MPNYLSNTSLLSEIRKSRNSYCEFLNDEDTRFDIRLWRDPASDEIVTVKPPTSRTHQPRLISNEEILEWAIDNDIKPTILRVTRDIHVPPSSLRKQSRAHRKNIHLAFEPYVHLKLEQKESGELQLREVLRSFWKGGFDNGHYAPERGRISDNLATALMLLVERIATKPNFSGYSYIDEMKDEALTQLIYAALLFEEDSPRAGYYPNPFAYYTTVANNCFIRVLNREKRAQDIRAEVILQSGSNAVASMPNLFSLGEPVLPKLERVKRKPRLKKSKVKASQPAKDKSKRKSPRQHKPEEIAQIREEWQEGIAAFALGKKWGCSGKRIATICKDLPRQTASKRLLTPDELEQIKAAYEAGIGLNKMADQFKIGADRIKRICKGIERPNGQGRATTLTEAQSENLRADYRAGTGLNKLAVKYRVGAERIKEIVKDVERTA